MESNGCKIPVFRLQVCRTCLQTEGQFESIYGTKAAELLNDCNFCTVSENDGLPNQICLSCLQILEQCFTFKQLCKKSEFTLRKAIKRDKRNADIINKKTNNEFVKENSGDSNEIRDVLGKNDCSIYTQAIKPDENAFDFSEGEEFILKEDLISFLDKPLPPPLAYQCKECNQSFNEEHDLEVHQSVHTSDLTCLACSKKFTGRQSLKRHLKIHLIQKPHMCKICSKSFPESYALVKHLRHHSGIPREKRHFCEECGQGFSEPYYLKVHRRKHTGERPLLCPNCPKSFADPRSLKTHVMIHSGDRPYKCRFCMKGFIQNANLTKHLRVHTGEKPYVCKICDKKFSQSTSLEKHLKMHKGEKTHL